jgi:protein XagA
MRLAVIAGATLAVTAVPSAQASAWNQKKGQAQVIAKAERMRSTRGYDRSGTPLPLPVPREDRAAGVFAEYGLTDRITLQLKGDWQSGEDAFVDYSGRGPVEVGLTWQAWRDDHAAISLYAGYAEGGEGRNAGYAAPGVGDNDWEVRVAAGRGFGAPAAVAGRWGADRMFVEAQVARRMRDGLPDEVRADLTAGAHFGADWMVLAQAFGGVTDDDGARWLSVETSVVRHLGRWSLQAGWRRTVAGRETPLAEGPVVALWRRF